MDLAQKHCVPCEGGVPPLNAEKIATYMAQTPGWKVLDGEKISHSFKFVDFKGAMAFINKVAEIAETEGHHPDIHVFYNRVNLELSTHAIRGLSENDFILAAKIDKLPK